MGRALVLGALVASGVGLLVSSLAVAADSPSPGLTRRAFLPAISKADAPTATPVPTPTPSPQPYAGPVQTIYLGSARLTNNLVVEERDTYYQNGREVFQDPTAPQRVAWYSRFGHPGFAGHNSIFAAHVDYVGYGPGPFAGLRRATIGDALYVTMANGDQYAYTVKSIDLIPTDQLDMDAVVFPPLASNTERVTLLSCGGDFVANPSGYGGSYLSRVVLVAERYVP